MKYKIVAFVVLLISFFIGWMGKQYQSALHDPVVLQEQVFEIQKGDSFNRITDKLIAHGIEVRPLWLKFVARQKKVTQKLKAGEYQLTAGLKAPELLDLFAQGKTRQYAITFPEGWTYKQIKQALQKNQYLKHTIGNKGDSEILSLLQSRFQHPEGLFFPDTYYFEKGTTDFSVLQRAFKKMQFVLQQEWSRRRKDLPIKSDYQALILASIVEKETADGSERPLISGVFTQRLRKNMMLQTDPTVIYGMGDTYKGNIRYKDLRKKTPYNTYTIKGLPPTPIAMPGQRAIHAVLHPEESNYLYFVSKGNGSHVFSSNLKDHNKAVDLYQRKRNRR